MIYVFGDYALDTERHELRRGERPCPLEPQVFAVLTYLIQHRDRVVSKQELLDHVWPETFVSEAALYQRLMQARQAVGDSSRTQRVIKTVPKQGYRFSLAVEGREAEAHRPETADRLAVEPPGTPPSVTTSPATQRMPVEERKLVTVLCGTLTNASGLAEHLGFDALRRVQQAFLSLAQEEIQRYEGNFQPNSEDGFVALFGEPVAQEDHARRALLAALNLQQRLHAPYTDFESRQSVSFAVHLGMHTGQVTVDGCQGEPQNLATVVGEARDLAIRLQALADPGKLLVSEATLRLVHGQVRSEAFGPVQVAGHTTPVLAYTVQGLGPWRPFMGQSGARTLSRFVGRDRELTTLEALLAQAQAGQGQVVGVMGEPGMGKSRLLYEFAQQVNGRPVTYVEGHCLSYGINTPYLPVLDLVRQLCGITDSDGSDAISHKVHEMLSGDLEHSVPYVLQLLGLSKGTEALSQLTPQAVKKRTFDVLRQLLLQNCRQAPLILSVENLHWIDPTSEEWLASLVEHLAQSSLLLLSTYRPGYRPLWMGKSYATQLALSRLSADDCITIVQSVLHTERLPDALVQTVLSKAAGNPFFLEELTHAVIERHGDDLTERVPDSVQGVLSTRMDRLPTASHELLQMASVIGKDVSFSLLQAVAGLSETVLDQHLQHLQAGEFLYELRRMPERAYSFRHALVQDVAYQSLLKSTRQQYHQRIVQVLSERFPEIAEEQPELLAYHYTEADLPERAVEHWYRAGQLASSRMAHVETVTHFRKGLALIEALSDAPQHLYQELTFLTSLAPVLINTEGQASPEVGVIYSRADILCQQVEDSTLRSRILRGLWNFYLVKGELEKAHEVCEQFSRLAQHLDDPALRMWGLCLQGMIAFYFGALAQAREHLENGFALYEPQQHRSLVFTYGMDVGVIALSFLAWISWLCGKPDQARQNIHRAAQLARDLAHPFSLVRVLVWAARIHHMRREPQQTRQWAEEAITLSMEQGLPIWKAAGLPQLGWALVQPKSPEEGIKRIRQGLDEWRDRGSNLWVPYYSTLLIDAYWQTGQTEEGLSALVEGMRLVEKTGECWWEAELHRLKGELLLQQAAPDVSQAAACFQQALDIARRQQAKSPELRAAMSLARLWQSQGKRTEAHKLLAPVCNCFTEGFDTADLQEASALLEALA